MLDLTSCCMSHNMVVTVFHEGKVYPGSNMWINCLKLKPSPSIAAMDRMSRAINVATARLISWQRSAEAFEWASTHL